MAERFTATGIAAQTDLQFGLIRQNHSPRNGDRPMIRKRAKTKGSRPMTKNELIDAVAARTRLPRTAAASAVDATFKTIIATLRRGGEVKIMGFGNFRVVKRAARDGRDPRNGEPVKVKSSRRPRFAAGKVLKDALNR